jgi:hypothetical protein
MQAPPAGSTPAPAFKNLDIFQKNGKAGRPDPSFLGAQLFDDFAEPVGVFRLQREAQVLFQLLDGARMVMCFDGDGAEIGE